MTEKQRITGYTSENTTMCCCVWLLANTLPRQNFFIYLGYEF